MSIIATIVVVTNIGFTAAYDTDRRNPSWVSYDLEPSEVVKAERRSFPFKADPRIPESDMKAFFEACEVGTIMDRGHLAPAADFNWSTNALRQTYYFSNIVPMMRKLNRGEWLKTEREVRELAASGTVHVVIFPTYDKQGTFIPSRMVKVAWGYFGVRFWNLENWNFTKAMKEFNDVNGFH